MSKVDVLLDTAVSAALFHTADGTAFADLLIDHHRETWRLRSKRFCAWLRQQYYERTWDAPSQADLGTALNVLEAQAQFEGPERKVSVRLAEQDGLIYLDLADERWRSIEIGPQGWRVATDPPVRFRRAAGMLPLPMPVQGGSIEELRPFLNLPAEDDFVLVIAWLLAALRSGGPYPVLAIAGEQGSAKTVLSKLLRSLVDPNAATVRAVPREERDLFIAASNAHVLAFDNLSALPPWLSDTLCRLASGGAFAVRQLYTDQDEVLFAAARPIILNGIEDVITRPDLADRAIALTLSSITEPQRRSEQGLWRALELARPQILGALLDTVAHGLRCLPTVRPSRLPRMADFALWATACETAIWPTGTFARAYSRNRRAAIDSLLDADPIAAAMREMMAERTQWTGTASDLLAHLARQTEHGASWNSPARPKNPRALAASLRRAQPFLRTIGIDIAFSREGRSGARMITVTTAGVQPGGIVSSTDYNRNISGPKIGLTNQGRDAKATAP